MAVQPKLRFKGFTDDWEKRKLGDISDITKLAGFEFTKYVNYKDVGKVIALRGLNIKNGKIVLNDVKYIDNSDFSKLNRSKLFKNDLLFTYVGTIGEVAIVPVDDRFYLAPNVARIRLNKGDDAHFLGQIIANKTFYNQVIYPLIATSSQPALSMENIRKFNIILPTLEEEQRLGGIFRKIDNLITVNQRKVNLLKKKKTAYLQKLFPKTGSNIPELRFKGYIDAWEKRQLDDVVEKQIKGKAQLKKLNAGKVEYLDTVRLNGGSPILTDGIQDVSQDDILILWDGSKAGTVYSGFEGTLGSTLKAYRTSVNSQFVYQFLRLHQKNIYSNYRTPNIPHVQKDFLNVFKIDIPRFEEQRKIGDFLSSLDNLITVNQRKVDLLKEKKKSLLQQTFI